MNAVFDFSLPRSKERNRGNMFQPMTLNIICVVNTIKASNSCVIVTSHYSNSLADLRTQTSHIHIDATDYFCLFHHFCLKAVCSTCEYYGEWIATKQMHYYLTHFNSMKSFEEALAPSMSSWQFLTREINSSRFPYRCEWCYGTSGGDLMTDSSLPTGGLLCPLLFRMLLLHPLPLPLDLRVVLEPAGN